MENREGGRVGGERWSLRRSRKDRMGISKSRRKQIIV